MFSYKDGQGRFSIIIIIIVKSLFKEDGIFSKIC